MNRNYVLNPEPSIQNAKPKPFIVNPKPSTINRIQKKMHSSPKPQLQIVTLTSNTLNPESYTLDPEPKP